MLAAARDGAGPLLEHEGRRMRAFMGDTGLELVTLA
jgi:hypothetical protein